MNGSASAPAVKLAPRWAAIAENPVASLRLRMGTTAAVGLIVLAVGGAMSGDAFVLNLLTTAAVLYPLAMSFNLLLGYAGLPSFAHPVYFGLGAYASSYAAVEWGWGFLPTVVFSAVLAFAAAALTALPTMRQRSHFLAIATLALLITANELYLQLDGLTGGVNGFLGIPSAAIGSITFDPGTFSFFVLALLFAVAAQLLQDRMLASRIGRTLAVLRTTPLAGRSVGMNLFRARLTVFALTGAIAGISGVMFARQNLFISPADFGLDRAVDLLFVLVLGGMGTRIGPIIGLAALLVLRELSNSFVDYRLVIFGALIILVLSFGKSGVGGALTYLARRLLPRREGGTLEAPLPPDDVLESERVGDSTLHLNEIDHYFSGVHSVDHVGFDLEAGTVMGVIGPNGAGKTTLLNIVTGIIRPSSGSITFGDVSLIGRTPEQIARLGVVRTFQHAQMIPDMSLIENVMVGFERFSRLTLAEQILHVGRSPREERRFREQAESLLEAVGVADAGSARAEESSYGVQRRAEIARCLAARPDIMLLDEPGAGLNDGEREILLPILDRLCRLGVGVLLIDHNVGFVSQACSTVVVLVNGAVIRTGAPAEVLRDPEVLRAYIGTGGVKKLEEMPL